MRFLCDWQHLSARSRLRGPEALASVLAQLEGWEAAAGSWEAEVLPARLADYGIDWLDAQCSAGRIAWARLRMQAGPDTGKGGRAPVRATPLAVPRRDPAGAAIRRPPPLNRFSRAQLVVEDAHARLFVLLRVLEATRCCMSLWIGLAELSRARGQLDTTPDGELLWACNRHIPGPADAARRDLRSSMPPLEPARGRTGPDDAGAVAYVEQCFCAATALSLGAC